MMILFKGMRKDCPRTPLGSSKKSGKQRYKGDTDEGDTAACHQLLHALGLRAG